MNVIPEQFLPESTLAVCMLPDPLALVQKFGQLPFYENLLTDLGGQSPEISANTSGTHTPSALENLLRKFPTLMQQFQQNTEPLFSAIRPIFDKSIAIALVDIVTTEDSGTFRFSPEFVFLADVSGSAGRVKNALEMDVIKTLQSKDPSVEFVIESFAGVDSYLLSNDQFQVYYTFIGNTFLLTLKGETLRKVISVSHSPRNRRETQDIAASLFHAASYRTVVDTVIQGDHEIRIYVDVRKLWHTLRPLIAQRYPGSQSVRNHILLELLDHYQLAALAWTFSLKDGGGYERLFYNAVPEDSRENSHGFSFGGLSELTRVGNGRFFSDLIIPANILYYSAIRGDLLNLWRQLVHSIEASSFSQQRERFQTWVGNIENVLQIDLEQEFLPALGQEMAISWYDTGFRHRFPRSQPTLEDFPLVLFVQIAKKQVIDQMLQKLLASSEAKNTIFRGTEIQAYRISGTITPLTVYVAFVRDFLVVSASRSVLRAVIATSQQGGELTSNSDYRELSVSFPDQGYAKGYINLKRILRRIQQRSSSQALDISSFEDNISGLMWVTTVVHGGLLTESFSTIGGTVVGTAALWLGVLLSETGY